MAASQQTIYPDDVTLIRARPEEPKTISVGGNDTLSYGSTTSLGSTLAARQSMTITADTYIQTAANGPVLVISYEPWDAQEHDEDITDAEVALHLSEFGARGNGVDEDTDAVQAAIDAATAIYTATGTQTKVIARPGAVYMCGNLVLKKGVWFDLNGATLKQYEDINGPFIGVIPSSPPLTDGDYYGTYDDITLSGGYLDPNEKQCSGGFIRIFWSRNLVIDGVTILDYAPPYTGNGLSGTMAMQLGGINGRVTNCTIKRGANGSAIHNDGIHIFHGQYWNVSNNNVQAGDDALVVGGEITIPSLDDIPDPIRYVNFTDNVVNATRGVAFKAYVVDTATGTDWEVTDITVSGLTGKSGINRNGGVSVLDQNAGAAGAQIRNIDISGVSLDVGSTSHDEVNAYGIWLQSAANVRIEGLFKVTDDATPTTGFRLIYALESDDVTMNLGAVDLPLTGMYIHTCRRLKLENSSLTQPAASTVTVMEVDDADVRLVDVDLLEVQSTETAIALTTNSSLRIRGGKIAHENGAASGAAFSTEAGTVALELIGVDLSDAYSSGITEANVTRLIKRDSEGVSDSGSGVYTPTLYNTTNVDASTAYECQYLRVGDAVTVSGKFDLDPTASAATELGMSLPIASNFATAQQAGGVATATALDTSLAATGDTTNDRISWVGVPGTTVNRSFHFTLTYRVI